jgi:hypothetical protein
MASLIVASSVGLFLATPLAVSFLTMKPATPDLLEALTSQREGY